MSRPAWSMIGLLLSMGLCVWLRCHTFAPTLRDRHGVDLWPTAGARSEPLDCDEAAYGYIGRRLAGGAVMYRDLTENKPPGGYWTYAAAVALGGPGETTVRVPASFGRLDHAYGRSNHSSQGLTHDSAHVLAGMLDREWAYVACSRSRFATTLYADASALGLSDLDSHRPGALAAHSRFEAIDALASRMRRSRAKGTSLDHEEERADISHEEAAPAADIGSRHEATEALGSRMVAAARRTLAALSAKRERSRELTR